ncbi:MAG: hypothetical protein ACKO2P_02145 [Planctomycetota bacterium]
MPSLLLVQLEMLSRRREFDPLDWLTGFWPMALAALGLVVAGWLAVRWANRVIEDPDPGETDRQMLQAIEDIRQGGDLSEDEFRLIKGRLAGRLSSLSSHPGATGKTAASAGVPRGLRRMSVDETAASTGEVCSESDAESVQPAQTSKPTNIRGSDLNPG